MQGARRGSRQRHPQPVLRVRELPRPLPRNRRRARARLRVHARAGARAEAARVRGRDRVGGHDRCRRLPQGAVRIADGGVPRRSSARPSSTRDSASTTSRASATSTCRSSTTSSRRTSRSPCPIARPTGSECSSAPRRARATFAGAEWGTGSSTASRALGLSSICNVLGAIKTAKYLRPRAERRGRHGRDRRGSDVRRASATSRSSRYFPDGFGEVEAAEVYGEHLLGHCDRSLPGARAPRPRAHLQPRLLHVGRAAGCVARRTSRRGAIPAFWERIREVVPDLGRPHRRRQRADGRAGVAVTESRVPARLRRLRRRSPAADDPYPLPLPERGARRRRRPRPSP